MNLLGVSKKPGMKAKFNIYAIFSLSGTEVSLKHIYVLLAIIQALTGNSDLYSKK